MHSIFVVDVPENVGLCD